MGMQTLTQNHYKIFTLEKRHQRQEIEERLTFKFSTKIAKRRYRDRKLVKTGWDMQTIQNHYKIFTLEKRHQRQEIQERHLSSTKRGYRDRQYCTRERERERERESNTKLIPELYGAPLNLLDSH
jgi:hypothetical protein